ncbi:MAG: DUF551 domain-containing protein [Pseudomonadales bacterium]
MTDWQPISSAPRDGSSILASDCGVIGVVRWQRDCWQVDAGRPGDYLNPTHWMPLPSAPEE